MPPKIQPVDFDARLLCSPIQTVRTDSAKLVLKSRLKRLFDRQFPGVLRNNSAPLEKTGAGDAQFGKDGVTAGELEPSSLCLDKMVQNFIEESNERQPSAKYGRNSCNCFNGNNDSSDDELDAFDGFESEFPNGGSFCDPSDVLKGLIPCTSVGERILLADTAKILEKNKGQKRKDDLRKIVVEGLSSSGYDSSICKSKWDKSPAFPAGEYEYIDVIIGGERLLVDIDFRSEFEIVRSTSAYKAILQSLPFIFVGKADRLCQIVAIVSEGAKQSLKKKGMHFPPWRKAEYMKAKWLSPYTRASASKMDAVSCGDEPEKDMVEIIETVVVAEPVAVASDDDCGGELGLIFGEAEAAASPEEEEVWRPGPARSVERVTGGRMVTGLACLLKDKP
ncbi:hypothetical protein MLD38_011980 [Melastoma candidum]|uniref:Uncharacterized protein n=1 Tax=Melastoma candidum TaxID=119954 RepID=A0ACB9R661_9MYRT|nr:hypothetical protein MLD38_011980 [Melastoma candidum]